MGRLTRKKKHKEKLPIYIVRVFLSVLVTISIAIIVGYILAKLL
ncbi:hypothetical protein [uncultured Clostridium sp.]|nr:hypothetical protein [uncultured Clostridium sp.]